jgi:hypothetical protein
VDLPTSRLKAEGSIMGSIATAALVIGIYSLNVGTTAQAHATPANDGNLQTSRRKASIQAAVAVSAITLLAKDVSILIVGGGVMVMYDWHLRHAIASDMDTGQLVDNNGYAPAQNVVPMVQQGAAVGGY